MDLIRSAVTAEPKPAVYISGGLDSTILLYHLAEKSQEAIHTYTFGFPDGDDEFEPAERVADEYSTIHRNIMIRDILPKYSELLQLSERPLFNLWIYWLAEAAAEDKCLTCYAAEGLDEHFGGYWYKPSKGYLELWADYYVYIKPAYILAHNLFSLKLVHPFLSLDFRDTLKYWDPAHLKTDLREAYRDLLPNFVLNRKKRPGRPDWMKYWERELCHYFPQSRPQTEVEVKELLNLWVTKVWLDHQLSKVKMNAS